MNPKRLLGLAGLVGLWVLTACQSTPAPPPAITPTPPPETLHIGIATAAQPLADLVADPYAQFTDRAHLQFVPADTAVLLNDLAAGNLDAVLVHALPADSGFWFNPVAWDGLVVVVGANNPVEGLSRAEVQAVFNGRITNWSSLGGPDQPITLLSRERGSGARTLFEQRIMAAQRLSINAMLLGDNAALLESLAATPGAVGYTMLGSVEGVKALALDGMAPTTASTADESYPLAAPLYFVAPAEPQGELRVFLSWLQSAEGQAVIAERYGRVR
ncbi:MAG: substrate-binding domain-containing protein [Anaerolineales bacterium]|nr:substrate-binding domain-containing protein [Anaerolineales bacterium]